MNILDANIIAQERKRLVANSIRFRQIGHEIGNRFDADADIIPMLRKQKRAAFFTRDKDFWDAGLCDENYCIVFLGIGATEVASYIRRFLNHPLFNTAAKRLGKVVHIHAEGISYYVANSRKAHSVSWPAK